MYTILSLHIYPVKGMPGLQVQQAQLEPEGFKYDRRWMLVDEQGTFISQRNVPNLVLSKIELDGDKLSIQINDSKVAAIYNRYSENEIEVSVFESKMKANEVDPAISAELSKALNKKVQLVQVSKATNRIKHFAKYLENWKIDSSTLPEKTKLSFADGYPYLLIGTASMDFLNQKLVTAFKLDRFRANIIVKTNDPHIEDNWQMISCGDQRLMGIKPCARCQVITINQQTGVRNKEPLLALSKYRKVNNKVIFGQNLVSLTTGIIRVGDSLKPNIYS